MAADAAVPDAFRVYEEGKHRRYSLLFSVNGGAFVVARLLLDGQSDLANPIVLGRLSLPALSYGMLRSPSSW
jgi:hypothetical protein